MKLSAASMYYDFNLDRDDIETMQVINLMFSLWIKDLIWAYLKNPVIKYKYMNVKIIILVFENVASFLNNIFCIYRFILIEIN